MFYFYFYVCNIIHNCILIISFVEEFVSSPLDGIVLLLEILRSIQRSQTIQFTNKESTGTASSLSINNTLNIQYYRRRALLDELTCL